MFAFFILSHVGIDYGSLGSAGFLGLLLSLGCLLFSLFLVNFIVQRNQLTAAHSFAMLFYTFFLVLFPETLLDAQVIYATFFLLLAERRLISMRSMKSMKTKIFDGALWIIISSLFVNWTIVFIILVWCYIYFYVPKQFNYWLIPVTAAVAVALTGWSVSYLLGEPDYLFRHYAFSLKALNPGNASVASLVKSGLFLLISLAAGVASFIKQGKSGQGKLTQFRLIVLGWFLGVLVVLLTGDRFRSTIMFIFLPSAVFMARYVELLRNKFLKDILILGMMVLCLGVYLFQWVFK